MLTFHLLHPKRPSQIFSKPISAFDKTVKAAKGATPKAAKQETNSQQKEKTVQERAIEIAQDVNKEFGIGTAATFKLLQNVPCIATNFAEFDKEIGGGLPKGQIVEIVAESYDIILSFINAIFEGNKQSLALIESQPGQSHQQQLSKFEENLQVICCGCGEDATSFVTDLIKEKINIIIVDSIKLLVPDAKTQIAKNYQSVWKKRQSNYRVDPYKAAQQNLRSIQTALAKNKSVVIFMSLQNQYERNNFDENMQLRNKINSIGLKGAAVLRLQIDKLLPDNNNNNNSNSNNNNNNGNGQILVDEFGVSIMKRWYNQ